MTTPLHRLIDFLLGTHSVIIISQKPMPETEHPKYLHLVDWSLDGREWMDRVEIYPHMEDKEIEIDIINQLKVKFSIAEHREVKIIKWTNLETLDCHCHNDNITSQEKNS